MHPSVLFGAMARATGVLLLACTFPAFAQVTHTGGLTLPGLDPSPAGTAQSTSIPLRADLRITTVSDGASGSIEATQRIASVSTRIVQIEYRAMKPDGSHVAATRNLRVEDLKNATSIRPNYVDGANEFFEGSTAFGASSRVLANLKDAGRSSITLDAGGISMNSGVQGAGLARELDGMLGEMGGFAGIAQALEQQKAMGIITEEEAEQGAATLGEIDALQLLDGTLRLLRNERIAVQVNGRRTELPAVVAIGTLSQNGESYEVELALLDDPANPLMLRSRVGEDTLRATHIDFPQ